ncbi:putative ABC transporter ATP-binding protein [compost metagenome]
MGAPNVLLLDEPTNDLDIGTLSVLEDYLDEFPGVVFTVSHDRYFLDRTIDKLIAFENGQIRLHVGDYSEYEEWLAKNVPAQSSADKEMSSKQNTVQEPVTGAAAATPAREKVKFTFKEQREYETIDEMIGQAEQHLEDITAQMEAAFADSGRLQELVEKQRQGEAELERLMERWTYLNELAEKIAGKA